MEDADGAVRPDAVTRHLDGVRSRIANRYLIGLSVLTGPGLAGSLYRAVDIGWQPIMTLHVLLGASIFAMTLLRRRLPYRVGVGYLVGLIGALGVAGLLSFGLASAGLQFFLSASILAFLLLGVQSGILTSTFCLLAIAAVYLMARFGVVTFAIDHTHYATALSSWINAGIGFVFLVSTIGAGMATFNRQLRLALRRAERERSDLAALTDRYKAARGEALAASESKSQFLANASHELRTPLNLIIGFSEYMLVSSADLSPERRIEYLMDIHASGKNLLRIVNHLLDLSRIEANRLEIEESEFDLAALIEEVIRVSNPLTRKSEVTVRMIEPAAPIIIRADRGIIYQVLFNLLSNAIKFNRRFGRVDIRPHWCPHAGAEIIVTDTGIGVDPAVIPELFQPFRQANSEIARQYGGTGLGLSIVSRLVTLHGGAVTMQSELGRGTTVRVTLPPSRVVNGQADPASPEASPEATMAETAVKPSQG